MASLGVSFKPVRLAVPVTRQGVLSRTNLTPTYPALGGLGISTMSASRPVHSDIRRQVANLHSHHGRFIDPRPITYTRHLWRAFLALGNFQR